MAYDEALADRVRLAMAMLDGVTEQKMFGGLCFLLNGHMVCGIGKGRFMARVGPSQYEVALAQPHVRPMDFTGRPMRGLIYVEPDGTLTVDSIRHWIRKGMAFVGTLPPKHLKSPSNIGRGAKQ